MLMTPEIRAAMDAVRKAAGLVSRIQAKLVTPSIAKSDRSPVTVADFASQAVISKYLQDIFPHDPLVGEEEAGVLQADGQAGNLAQVVDFVREVFPGATELDVCQWIDRGGATPGDRFWTVDPIDGTKGFLRGDQYAVALALIVDGQVEVGVLGCPNLTDAGVPQFDGKGSLVVAARGQGTWFTPLADDEPLMRLHVSTCSAAEEARLLRSFESAHTNTDQVAQLATVLGTHASPIRMDSQAKYAVLASGHGELLIRLLSPDNMDYQEKIWDHAAGCLVVEEAGGRVTDIMGRPLDFSQGRTLASNRGVLATNGLLHDAALSSLAKL